ncbi:cation-translocating P-type ATPase [Lactobacillus johnsonii]|uniref:P-type Ca(2+) transporter n=1 Tax=Lactobacillus johnsonii ATCC 33200 TaxID=525330 RepID=C2E4L4_LACJH|nr:cation-translocating P-type ATPase [Lactobacillus johnsonii]EEJ60239.1 putative potassium/sodium efflux P-type ATPase, fungal-type [Lactobacillus johnsonii ATCC 33200]KRK54724.1 calcium-transporting ATPase [Lactobacillus johnsonii ATCC 33200]MCF0084855.1 cation-translocating P-type ATPase [Lactobacillus johnsonii]MCT3322690.1 cation-translocating P-type ATPase [Lactobacillus johnsonii]MCT3381610.1 cation-translocating P-type ATPase [Lactobacillus johnsonii]
MDSQKQPPAYSQTKDELFSNLETSSAGLSEPEVDRRLKKYGHNVLNKKSPKSILNMLKEQIFDPMILILLGAATFSALLNEWVEAGVIFFIVIINSIIGIIQEKKAQASLAALKTMSAPTATVIRNGSEEIVSASELVVGDLVILTNGDMVPADLRLTQSNNLKITEASLTGESIASEKNAAAVLSPDCPLGDRKNMAYTSSIVTYGRGSGIVTKTGMNTEIGQIAGMLEDDDTSDTPLKRKLNAVGKILTIIGLIICVLIFAIGAFYGRPLLPQFLVAISLAISIIPEGLPATATIIMALGVQRMAKEHALIKNLPAVETLGNATVICSDKTGTLTLNKMTVTHLANGDDFLNKKILKAQKAVKNNNAYKDLMYAASLCNDASLSPASPEEIIGDPTEGALIPLAQDFGYSVSSLRKEYPRLGEYPFDSIRKRMSTIHEINNEYVAYIKGALDELLPLCDSIATSNGVQKLTKTDKENILALSHKMSDQALRVLGFASRTILNLPQENENIEQHLVFLGAVGMIDPARDEVKASIKMAREAGIKTIMITGDHKNTAVAIAKNLGIYANGNTVISGTELNEMTDSELDQAVKSTTVFARVSPNDKLRIIQSLKRNEEVVAMTGDGVNDSPALKAANIGVAMGISGTDVAKDVSDMILLNDSFTTITAAIKEGRKVYRNIQKVIQFLLVGNIAEITTLFIATLFNWDAPLLAVHILWVNLATASLPALALGVDPASKNIMKHKPVKTGTLFERDLVWRVISQGIFVALMTLLAYWIGDTFDNPIAGQTMAFCVLALSQMLRAFNQHSNTDPIWIRGNKVNIWLIVSFIVSAILMGVILFTPNLQSLFHLTNLTSRQWLVVIILSLFSILQVELMKLIKRSVKARQQSRALESVTD